jgi:hypothetical protein
VPEGLKGEFTAVMSYDTRPFAVKNEKTKFTIK